MEQYGSWDIAHRAEVPGATGQGQTRDEYLDNLREAIALIFEHRRERSLRSVPPEAKHELVIVGGSATPCCATFGGTAASFGARAKRTPFGRTIRRGTQKRSLAMLRSRLCRRLSIPDPWG
jgi:predicted RNase H-like HicB family nuclease